MNIKNIFNSFDSKKVLIIGDAMIDAYMWGDIERFSPEAPVPIVKINKHENRLGGAANVALNIKALGGIPVLCSVIGNKNDATIFKNLMNEAGLSQEGILIEEDRITTKKTRVIAKNKHQVRIDEEDTHPIKTENKLIELIYSLIENINVIILQDYNKGVLTENIIQKTIKIANKKNIPTIVDPKKQNFNTYKNCSIFKPNLTEIQEGMNISINADNTEELKKATSQLRESLNTNAILLTLSEKGICVHSKHNFQYTPNFKRNIVDVSGAGDTVISIAALCLANKIKYRDLSVLCTLAGGLVCEEVGVVPINKAKLILEAKKSLT